MTDGCLRYNCIFNCDDRWNCPFQRPKNVCCGSSNGGSNSNCRHCQRDGITYKGNSRFQYTDGCSRFNCDCNCDGSWNCPASKRQNVWWNVLSFDHLWFILIILFIEGWSERFLIMLRKCVSTCSPLYSCQSCYCAFRFHFE